MTYWNYRVLKKTNSRNNDTYFEVCEVYYDENNRPHSWTDDKHLLAFEELDDIKTAYKEIQKAFQKPVLEVVGNELKEI